MEVLEKLGYLIPATHSEPLNKLGSLLQWTAPLRRLIPQRLRTFINTHLVSEATHDKAYASAFSSSIDWEKTIAFPLEADHFQGFISFNLKGREPQGFIETGADLDARCAELTAELRQLENADTGRPAVHDVIRVADVYQGPNLLELPDLIIQWAEETPITNLYHPRFGTISDEGFALRRTQHAPDGFLLAGGKHINEGEAPERADTVDFAPTILYMMNQPIPAELDGQILFDLLDENFKRQHEPRFEEQPSLD